MAAAAAFSAAVRVIRAGAIELSCPEGEPAEAKPMVTGLELGDAANEFGLEVTNDEVDLTKVAFEVGLFEIRRDEVGFETTILAEVVAGSEPDEAGEISLEAWYGFEELTSRVLMIGC